MFNRPAPIVALVAAVLLAAPHGAYADPGDSLAAERARLAANKELTPLHPVDGDSSRYVASSRAGSAAAQGTDGFDFTLVTSGPNVTSEYVTVKVSGKPYTAAQDAHAIVARLFNNTIADDVASSAVVVKQQQDPQIVQTFRNGKYMAYRTVDDSRNSLHLIEFMLHGQLAASMKAYAATPPTRPSANASVKTVTAPSGKGAAIFAVDGDGDLLPIAIRTNGVFMSPGSNEGGPPEKLRTESNASLASGGNRVHIIFGGRTVATVPAKMGNGGASVTVPPSLHLAGYVTALASPTLEGTGAKSDRRAPTAKERKAALDFAATKLHTTAARLTVRNLTAIDLGRGMALVGTLNLRGTTTPRVDKRMFFVLEPNGAGYTETLSKMQTITVSEPLLEEPAEYLVDTLDLGNGTPALVTHVIGYDADTFEIYTRTPTHTWKNVYGGGGAAL